MVNPYRGEVCLTVDGVDCAMRLSLGALAQLEVRLGAEGLLPLIERFETGQFKADDLIALLWAGLSAAGWAGSEADLSKAEIAGGPMIAARCAAQLLRLTFTLPESGDD
nr:gene transfer agent family protein [Amylibacter sp.]